MYHMTMTEKPTVRAAANRLMPATEREHLVTVVCGLWMTVGLFLDGYFHQNLDGTTESFLTPWHAVFYSGFAASALWIGSMSRRRDGGSFDWQLRHLPAGYELARVGLALFAAGAVGDSVWHSAFGVERGIDALLSPTHLLLFVGLVLILTAPFRAATASPSSPSPWMVATSLISATALVGFFLNFAWGLGIAALARTAYDPVSQAGETHVIAGVGSTLVTTVVLFGAARMLVGRRPPPGAYAAVFGVVSLLVSAAFDEDIEGVAAGVVGGVLLDVLMHTRTPRAVSFAVASGTMWLIYLGLLALEGIEWQAEIWIGAVVLNTIAAYVIAPQLREELES